MTRRFTASMLLVVVLAGATPLLAHHGNASYENKEVTIKGKVTNWLWTNPHTFLMLDVTDENGKRRVVDRLEAGRNAFESDEQYHRFSIDPLAQQWSQFFLREQRNVGRCRCNQDINFTALLEP